MRFATLGSGKRIRPILSVLISEAAKGKGRSFALDAGCAIECVHTASLVLDDLPCMDDANMRRGQSATHKKFGEATAILAAIGLLNRAYGIIAENTDAADESKTAALKVLSNAIGSNGMIAGQEIDLHQRSEFRRAPPIEDLNWLKTGVLFVASAHIGAIAAGLDETGVKALKGFAKSVGLAFQTADDLIDQSADPDKIGKDVGKDVGMPTLVSLSGPEAARRSCEEHLEDAENALAGAGLDRIGLAGLVDSIFGSKI
ncbi:polyprenyl synthetase family protein [Hoeflea prorocentri]|uniref:Probable farnesyl diphosphate synthase n=1 Tax=Hoeflea prorocentri TaxID=1922333 RepID=A0A9X3ZH62_9HYPH|nr:polyprenyl synthetase family protein [Hoeflea prorocentri]MCY6380566.1 polyprenyl synthetase family protein [Hoeflea prorocentri]MDA5398366.1 polyprenyl synthetase family protein [Hoeflea prorocentri]